MKKMFIAAAACMACACAANAQTFGLRAGYNLTNITDGDTDPKSGFNVGLSAEFPIVNNFGLETGLYFSTKGAKVDEHGVEVKSTPMYIEVPVMPSFKLNLCDDIAWNVCTGPYLAFGVGGKTKYDVDNKNLNDALHNIYEDYDFFGDKDNQAKRFDFGWSFGTGITWDCYYFGLRYDLGITKLYDNGDAKNTGVSFNIGYNF